MRQKSIVKKLIVYFLLLNILTVIVIGSYSYFRAKDALMKRTFDQLTSIRIEKKFRIERFFADRKLDMELVSRSEDAKNLLSYLDQTKASEDTDTAKINDEYNSFLRKHFFSGNFYKRFFVVNEAGEGLIFGASEGDEKPLQFLSIEKLPFGQLWIKLSQSAHFLIEDYQLDAKTNQPAIFLGAAVFSPEGKRRGIVVTELNIESINAIMLDNNPENGLGQSGESYLAGSDFLMRSNSRFQDDALFKTAVKTAAVKAALQGETGTAVITDYRNITVLSSFSRVEIPNLNWALVTEIDAQEALIPIRSLRNNILYLSILMSLLLFAFVYVIAKRISLPIVKLKHAAEQITTGKYDVLVEDYKSNDEISSLVYAFNEMSAKIKTQTENLNQERSMRLSSMIDGQEIERQRLARELHDGLGQSILAIKMRLERTANASPEKSKQIMEEVQMLFANTIQEIRNISNNLVPAVLNELGLADALQNLCREVTKSSAIKIDCEANVHSLKNTDKINTYLYRIAQEALNNAVKHSKASHVSLNIYTSNKEVFLKIKDNGKGFNYDSDKKFCGNGLNNMKERVHLLNGKIHIDTILGEGTTLNVIVPYTA